MNDDRDAITLGTTGTPDLVQWDHESLTTIINLNPNLPFNIDLSLSIDRIQSESKIIKSYPSRNYINSIVIIRIRNIGYPII